MNFSQNLDFAGAVSALRTGGIGAIPTETVYGLAGNALDQAAIARIFAVKNRPVFDPLIIHISSAAELEEYAFRIPERAWQLAAYFWPGPLTLLLPRRANIADLVTAGSHLAAFRVPAHPVALALLEQLDFPLAAPSANPFGYISPTTAAHVEAQLGGKIDFILDGGPCSIGVESTIIGFEGLQPTIYRQGGVEHEAIETVLKCKISVADTFAANPKAPGMLESHYAPRTRMLLENQCPPELAQNPHRLACLRFCEPNPDYPEAHQLVLSPDANMAQAAQNLFAYMRRLDALSGIDVIVAQLVPPHGLGRAINDRIRRAASK